MSVKKIPSKVWILVGKWYEEGKNKDSQKDWKNPDSEIHTWKEASISQETFGGLPVKSQLQHRATFMHHTQRNRNTTFILSLVSNAGFHS